MPMTFRALFPCLWILLFVLSASAVAQHEPVLLEGFEVEANLRTSGGEAQLVEAKAAVTQGRKALQLGRGASAQFFAEAKDISANQWLNIDTFVAGDEPVEVGIQAELGRADIDIQAVVGPGKDTLRLPLDWARRRAGASWPSRRSRWQVANLGPEAVVVDNIRLEPEAAPEQTRALDFGPEGQAVWPGFAASAAAQTLAVWSGVDYSVREYAFSYPDPLVADLAGYAYPNMTDTLRLANPHEQSTTAWLWVTHYGYAYGGPAPQWWVRRGSQALAGADLTLRERFGPEGITEGLGGQWTPRWFSREYARHFYTLVKVDLPGDGLSLELRNAQVAAMVIASPENQMLAASWVENVEDRLATFRRQFIVGKRDEAACDVTPTEAEERQGFMLFAAGDQAVPPATWSPTAQDRLDRLDLEALAGTRVVARFVLVPLRDQVRLRGRVMALRSSAGLALRTPREANRVFLLERVARIKPPRVEFQPWVLRQELRSIPAGRPVHLMAEIEIDHLARAGEYDGVIHVVGAGSRVAVPISLSVKSFGLGEVPDLPAVAYRNWVSAFLPGILQGINTRQREAINAAYQEAWIEAGGTSLALRGAHQRGEAEAWIKDELVAGRFSQVPKFQPPHMIDLHHGQYYLDSEDVQINSSRYGQEIALAAQRSLKMARALRLERPVLTLDYWDPDEVRSAGLGGGYLRQAGALPGVHMALSDVSALSEADRAKQLDPFVMLLLRADGPNLRKIVDEFEQMDGDRQVLLYTGSTSRVLGGLYAAASGVRGVEYARPMARVGAYRGFGDGLNAMLAWGDDGRMRQMLPMLWMRQGRSDYRVIRMVQTLLERGKGAGANVNALSELLAEIHSQGNLPPEAHGLELGLPQVGPERLAELRAKLLDAGQMVADRL